MPAYRIGFGSDFNLANQFVGIGTTTADVRLEVTKVLKGDFNVTGVATLTSYGGFAAQKQLGDDDVITGEVNSISEDIVVSVGKTFTVSVGATVYPGTLEHVSIGTHFSFPNGGIAARPEEPIEGTVRFNDDLNTLEFYNGVEWRQFTVDGSSGRGVFGGGFVPGAIVSNIDYINISSTGNAIQFGVLSTTIYDAGGCSSATRGLFGGGTTPTILNTIDYITIASEGNSIDFGDLTVNRKGVASCSSSTRGIWAGGYNPSPTTTPFLTNIIDYVQISTIGNALDFGDLTSRIEQSAGCSSSTRGIFAGGITPTSISSINSITISSVGNAITFGDLTVARRLLSGAANSTRGVFAGGGPEGATHNTIDFITISSFGNAQDFGDLTATKRNQGGVASQIRGVFAGGSTPTTNAIDYVTIASTGNAQDFGDLTLIREINNSSCSDSHGGLGGF